MNYKDYIETIPDFPIEGILFRDITPLLANGEVFYSAVKEIAEFAKSVGAEAVYGPESRGFMIGCPVATELKIGFVPVRKPGKLPRKTVSAEYALEYGTNKLEITADSIVGVVSDAICYFGCCIAKSVINIHWNGKRLVSPEHELRKLCQWH